MFADLREMVVKLFFTVLSDGAEKAFSLELFNPQKLRRLTARKGVEEVIVQACQVLRLGCSGIGVCRGEVDRSKPSHVRYAVEIHYGHKHMQPYMCFTTFFEFIVGAAYVQSPCITSMHRLSALITQTRRAARLSI